MKMRISDMRWDFQRNIGLEGFIELLHIVISERMPPLKLLEQLSQIYRIIIDKRLIAGMIKEKAIFSERIS